jgi:hypothetical protein
MTALKFRARKGVRVRVSPLVLLIRQSVTSSDARLRASDLTPKMPDWERWEHRCAWTALVLLALASPREEASSMATIELPGASYRLIFRYGGRRFEVWPYGCQCRRVMLLDKCQETRGGPGSRRNSKVEAVGVGPAAHVTTNAYGWHPPSTGVLSGMRNS